MGKVAFLFPGQGAQYPGMGRELADCSPAARAVFGMADRLRPGTSEQCFNGTADMLAVTENTQPCLFCADLAAAAALREAGVRPDMLAGFSLGELAALAFSGAAAYEDAFRLVIRRARHMQKASEAVTAAMLAVLKLDDGTVTELCSGMDNVYPVNFNCPGQVVVSGEAGALEALKERVRDAGGKALPLKVGGGFHSPFMAPAAGAFINDLDAVAFTAASVPLYANVTAMPYGDDYRDLLSRQIKSPVLWRKTIENMMENGAVTFIECGPGKVLSGLVSRISDQARVYNAEDEESLKRTVSEVTGHA